MPEYRTILVRSFSVVIVADDEICAASLSELYVGFSDDSTSVDREKYNFEIREIELIENDVIEQSLFEE